MGRRELRECIFQLLFMTEFNPLEEVETQETLFLENIDNLKSDDQEYIHEKCDKIRVKLSEIDQEINQISKGWKTSRMSKVDLTILRVAAYEALFDEDVPVGVAINEAVELAKKFGGDDSASFINGILGKLVKSHE